MSPNMRVALIVIALGMLCVYSLSRAADYTRDGGTADWMCCSDKVCTTIISQHADAVRATKACEKLTDADGTTRYVRSNPFRITKPVPILVGAAFLSWTAPTTNTDGSPLTNLSGYRIVYGTSATQLIHSVQIAPNLTSYPVEGLTPATWYFAIYALTPTAQSVSSNIASKVVL